MVLQWWSIQAIKSLFWQWIKIQFCGKQSTAYPSLLLQGLIVPKTISKSSWENGKNGRHTHVCSSSWCQKLIVLLLCLEKKISHSHLTWKKIFPLMKEKKSSSNDLEKCTENRLKKTLNWWHTHTDTFKQVFVCLMAFLLSLWIFHKEHSIRNWMLRNWSRVPTLRIVENSTQNLVLVSGWNNTHWLPRLLSNS